MGNYSDIPDRPLCPPEEGPIVCSKCGSPFCFGDTVYMSENGPLCEECFRSWALDLLETSPGLVAEKLGIDTDVADVGG